MNKYKIGLVIGRFQPLHKGHVYLIKESLKYCDQLIIGIGSANKKSQKNPWSAAKRRKMLKDFVRANKFEKRIIKIINLYDNPDDDVWFENLIKKTGKFDVTLGNNPWNNGIIARHGIKAIEVGFYNREKLEGVKIRELMRTNSNWKDRVPSYIFASLTDNF